MSINTHWVKAKQLYYQKNWLNEHIVIELEIHEVPRSAKYPDGLKYGLICVDTKSGSRVLFDNHHPKGPHIHIDKIEIEYKFTSVDQLIEDFKAKILSKFGVVI